MHNNCLIMKFLIDLKKKKLKVFLFTKETVKIINVEFQSVSACSFFFNLNFEIRVDTDKCHMLTDFLFNYYMYLKKFFNWSVYEYQIMIIITVKNDDFYMA